MFTCGRCGATFDATLDNPGTTWIGGYTNVDGSDSDHVETLHLCDACISIFFSHDADGQHALVDDIHKRMSH